LPPDGSGLPGYEDALRQALEHAERVNDKPNTARAALLLGSALGERGAWVEAQEILDRACSFAEQTDDQLLQAEAYRLLGSALLQGSAYEDAWLAYNEAIRRFESLGDQQRATRTRLLLVPLLLQFGHVAPAGPHLEALRRAAHGDLPDALRDDLERVARLGELAASAAKH
jgi:tetratricopeptide (TPR) repeat protein